jgi:folate-binding protein YgfZ
MLATVKLIAEPAQYEAARHGAIVVARSDRAFLCVYGREPVKMMQGLITNDLELASPSRAVYATMLTPKGKLVAELRLYRRAAEVLLEMDAGAKQNVIDHLKKYVPPLFAKAEDPSQSVTLVGVYGPHAAEALKNEIGDEELPEQEDHSATVGDLIVVRSLYTVEGGYDVVAPAATATELIARLQAAGATPAGLETLDVLRIEAGRPRWGAELDENVIPLEAGLRERTISQSKGCYTGQEVIIRILHRGHVNRHLRGVRLGSLPVPDRDTALFSADHKAVGKITSACFSPRFGETIALGYARRELTPPAIVRLGSAEGPEVQLIELPFAAAVS